MDGINLIFESPKKLPAAAANDLCRGLKRIEGARVIAYAQRYYQGVVYYALILEEIGRVN